MGLWNICTMDTEISFIKLVQLLSGSANAFRLLLIQLFHFLSVKEAGLKMSNQHKVQ